MRGQKPKNKDKEAPMDLQKAKEAAFNLLSRKSVSKHEMVSALKKRGVSSDDCAEIVEYLTETKYLDDAAFARSMAVKLLRDKLFAPDRVIYELTRHGIKRELASEILGKVNYNIDAAIARIIEKNSANGTAGPDKIAGALNRRGFRYEQYADLLREYRENLNSEETYYEE